MTVCAVPNGRGLLEERARKALNRKAAKGRREDLKGRAFNRRECRGMAEGGGHLGCDENSVVRKSSFVIQYWHMSHTITIRLTEELATWLKETARKTGLPVGRIIRQQLESAKER